MCRLLPAHFDENQNHNSSEEQIWPGIGPVQNRFKW